VRDAPRLKARRAGPITVADPIPAMPAALSIPPFLADDVVALRHLVPADVDGPYLEWFNDLEVCRLNSHGVFPYTRDEALDWVGALPRRRDALVLAITLRDDDRHVGNVSLQAIDAIARSAELAIVVGDRGAWGRGVGSRAAALIVGHGFAALNLRRVACGTLGSNAGMRRIAERLGMRQEGVRRQAAWTDGGYHDVIEYGLLAEEWTDR
jgi:RimJ/RimL family protein N-acetyltransferase